MLIHLLQLVLHVLAVDIKGMPNMVYAQVMPNQHIPPCWLLNPWHQVLQSVQMSLLT